MNISEFLSLEWVQPHEEALTKQPQQRYAVQRWIDYLNTIDEQILSSSAQQQPSSSSALVSLLKQAGNWVGRRAVAHLPRSYKLWKCHWEFVVRCHHAGADSSSSSTLEVVRCFERCLATLSPYPRVWMEYLQWILTQQQQVVIMDYTFLRRTINRALQSVAVAQHQKLWDVIAEPLLELDSNSDSNILLQYFPWESAHRLLQRYCQFSPAQVRVEYAAWCERHGRWGAAATAYQELLNDSHKNVNQPQHWQSFCELVAQHSQDCEAAGIPWEAILQTAIRQQREDPLSSSASGAIPSNKEGAIIVAGAATRTTRTSGNTTTMLGLLYSWLASAWIQRGSFDMARSVYEEGLLTVRTVRDFSILYAAYLQLEEGLLTAITDRMEEQDNNDDDEEAAQGAVNNDMDDDDWDLLLSTEESGSSCSGRNANAALAELELAMARAEHLTARRPLLLNAVKLRQNPNDCAEWMERANLYCQADQPRQAMAALEEALQTIQEAANSSISTAPFSQVVKRLVQIYVDHHGVTAARDLLDRVCRQRSTAHGLRQTQELAECWAAWVELELKHEAWDEALALAREAVARDIPRQGSHGRGGGGTTKFYLTRSPRLWDLLLDLEESLGTVQTTKDAYNRALETKVATVQHVHNFGAFLTEQNYFEEALAAYERGLELFAFPHAGAKLLWKAYLEAFLKRYLGSKVERVRNLFQRCLKDCPPEICVDFFMMNGEFEEAYGLTKRALSVYRTMCETVPMDEKYSAYQLYITKTVKYLGLSATRDIYQDAIEKLSKDPASAVKMCRDFAKMEVGLQQTERARAIYAYGAQSADPRRMPEYWKDWNDFEIANGNEETFREMLRIKRSIEAAFSTVNYNAVGMSERMENLSHEEAMKMVASAEGIDLDDGHITSSKRSNVSGFVSSKRTAAVASLHDVEERVAKLRKATGSGAAVETLVADDGEDDDEIDIDDIDAEIEEAASEGAEATAGTVKIDNVSTKAVPDSVFGSLRSTED